MSKIVKAWAPNGWKDVGVRTLKTFVAALAGGLLVAGFTSVPLVLGVVQSAATTAATYVLNALLMWAQSE